MICALCALCLLVLEAARRPFPLSPDARLLMVLSGPANGFDGGLGWEMRNILPVFYAPNLKLCALVPRALCMLPSVWNAFICRHAQARTAPRLYGFPQDRHRLPAQEGKPLLRQDGSALSRHNGNP